MECRVYQARASTSADSSLGTDMESSRIDHETSTRNAELALHMANLMLAKHETATLRRVSNDEPAASSRYDSVCF